MTQMPPPTPGSYVKPHRGTTILVLGILSLVINFACALGWILGIIAWVMGNTDLREMEAGVMDRSGEGLTNAGKICGMISVILAIAGLLFYLVLFVIIGIGAAASAGASGGGGSP